MRPALTYLLLALVLWPSLMQLPRPASIAIFDGTPMALDYVVRQDLSLGRDVITATGPLGALLTEVHSGQLLWLNYWCQVLASATFALTLSWVLLRLPATPRAWLAGALVLVAGFRPEYLHLTLLLVGAILLVGRPVHWLEAAGTGIVLGVLGLIDANHAGIAIVICALGLAAAGSPAGRRARWAAVAGFAITLFTGWVWCGQPAGALPIWLWHGVMTSPLRHPAAAAPWIGSAPFWAALTGGLVIALLAGTVFRAARRTAALALPLVLLLILGHAWRQATGQPTTSPQTFFAAAVMAALLWHTLRPAGTDDAHLRRIAIAATIAGGLGLVSLEPRIVTESILLLNQKIGANLTAIGDRRGWQNSITETFKGETQLFALPRIKAATAGQRTDFLGNSLGHAFLNRVDFAPRPGLQSYLVGEATLAERDAAYYAGATAPAFVVQRLQAFDRGLAALEDAPAQRVLYANYDFQFEENGFVLWQRRARVAATAPRSLPAPILHTSVAWGRPVTLPIQPGRAYWVSVHPTRSFTGWLKHQLLAPADPTLLLRDRTGSTLSYRAAPASLATGFLLTPLFRGEIDLIRYQAGEALAPIEQITLQAPAGRGGDFTATVELDLYETEAPAVSGRKEGAEALVQRFRIANRLPVAVAAYLPPQATRIDQDDILLSHPDCSLEFPLQPDDRQVQGRFGILAGAYQNGNATDGVEFVLEYVPNDGRPVVLWHRHLDPVLQPGDRGMQRFSVTLPQPVSGRVILRTQNLPGHNSAWDWALWSDLQFGSPPASK